MRALLIDDDSVDRQLICKLLKSTGLPVDVTEAEDAIAALDAISSEDFDCLLVDQRMPGIIGTEFIRAFRDMKGDGAPIVVLSGEDANSLTAEQAVGAGGDFFLAKQDMTAGRLKAVLSCFEPKS
ncbi:MAG: response regulator [Alphaproteobacteria bacterium]